MNPILPRKFKGRKVSSYWGMGKISLLGNKICHQHKLLHYLKDGGIKTCLILLNQPLESVVFKPLWKSSVIKVCTDGGINRLNAAVGSECDVFIPDIISGDFDSARDELLSQYQQKGAEVIPTPDQDETDFTKGLRVMLQALKKRKVNEYDCIVCLGAFGGRFDHVMSNINTLFTAYELQKKPCFLLSSTQVVCLLQPGWHCLHLDTGLEGNWCGLIPIGTAASQVYTTGLKWNLNGDKLSFGSLISTSNTFEDNAEVTVETTDPILWTMGVNFK